MPCGKRQATPAVERQADFLNKNYLHTDDKSTVAGPFEARDAGCLCEITVHMMIVLCKLLNFLIHCRHVIPLE